MERIYKAWVGDVSFRLWVAYCQSCRFPLVVGFDTDLPNGCEVEMEGIRCLVVRDATEAEMANFSGVPGHPFEKLLDAPQWLTREEWAQVEAVAPCVGVPVGA